MSMPSVIGLLNKVSPFGNALMALWFCSFVIFSLGDEGLMIVTVGYNNFKRTFIRTLTSSCFHWIRQYPGIWYLDGFAVRAPM